jgi:hypothetical protein
MTEQQIEYAARLWNQRMDTCGIATVVMLDPKAEPLVYRMLWRGIIPKAIAMRQFARS